MGNLINETPSRPFLWRRVNNLQVFEQKNPEPAEGHARLSCRDRDSLLMWNGRDKGLQRLMSLSERCVCVCVLQRHMENVGLAMRA